MPQLLGIVDLIWKGKKLPIVQKGAKIKLSGLKNNAVVYGRQAGRAQEWVPGEVSAKTHLKRGQRFSDVYDVGEGELQVMCDTGQTYVCPDAFLTDMPEMTSGEGGDIELKWAFGEYEEILNG